MPISLSTRGLLYPVALCCLALLTACGGGQEAKPAASTAPAFRPVTSEVASRALATLTSLYATRGAEIGSREVGGRFRLDGEGQFVPADLAYLSGKIEILVDNTRPLTDRLGQGTEAVTVLIAGYRTTEMSEFGIAAHDVLDFVSALSDGAGDASIPSDFRAARLAPLEQQLKALETSCTCR